MPTVRNLYPENKNPSKRWRALRGFGNEMISSIAIFANKGNEMGYIETGEHSRIRIQAGGEPIRASAGLGVGHVFMATAWLRRFGFVRFRLEVSMVELRGKEPTEEQKRALGRDPVWRLGLVRAMQIAEELEPILAKQAAQQQETQQRKAA